MGGAIMRTARTVLRGAAALLATTALAMAPGCGGGGGSSTPVYKGSEAPATISVADADSLTAAVMTASSFNFPALASFTKSGGALPGSPDVAGVFNIERLHRAMLGLGKAGDGARQSVKVRQDCPGGGSLTVQAPSATATTGIFKETFSRCDLGDGFQINGGVTDDVATSTATTDIGTVQMSLSMTLSGAQFRFLADADYDMDSSTLVNHTIGDFEYWDVAGAVGMRIQDMDATQTFADATDWSDDCALTDAYAMTVYDSVFGAVDVATTGPVTYSVNKCTNPGPVSGGDIVLTGDAGGTITLTPLSTSQATLAVDVDGDSSPELSATALWTDLGFQ
jgi:hypothetical protein